MHLEDLHPHQVGPKWIDGSMNTCERVVVLTSVVAVSCQHSLTEPRVAVFWWDHLWKTTRENIKHKAWHDCSIAINFMHLNLGPTINLLQVLQCWKRLYLIISWWWCLVQGCCNQEITHVWKMHTDFHHWNQQCHDMLEAHATLLGVHVCNKSLPTYMSTYNLHAAYTHLYLQKL